MCLVISSFSSVGPYFLNSSSSVHIPNSNISTNLKTPVVFSILFFTIIFILRQSLLYVCYYVPVLFSHFALKMLLALIYINCNYCYYCFVVFLSFYYFMCTIWEHLDLVNKLIMIKVDVYAVHLHWIRCQVFSCLYYGKTSPWTACCTLQTMSH